jgi:hypothetical protein
MRHAARPAGVGDGGRGAGMDGIVRQEFADRHAPVLM